MGKCLYSALPQEGDRIPAAMERDSLPLNPFLLSSQTKDSLYPISVGYSAGKILVSPGLLLVLNCPGQFSASIRGRFPQGRGL